MKNEFEAKCKSIKEFDDFYRDEGKEVVYGEDGILVISLNGRAAYFDIAKTCKSSKFEKRAREIQIAILGKVVKSSF